MRPSLLGEKILSLLSHTLLTTSDLLAAFLESGYGASRSKLLKNFEKREFARLRGKLESERRQQFYNTLSRLKREGLVARRANNEWKLTALGKIRLQSLQNNREKSLPRKKYKKTRSANLTICTFDIPEKERHKRDWLRYQLKILGFSQLQKSLWIGKIILPQDFIEDLRSLSLVPCVHIFSISKSGTIEVTE